MRRSVIVLALGLAGAGLMGCKSTKEKLRDTLQQSFEDEQANGMQLCGFPVAALTNVQVTALTHTGSNSAGSGTATVTATPAPMPGMGPVTGTCVGTVQFAYNTSRSQSGSGRRRRVSSTLQIYNLLVSERTGTAQLPQQQPGMMGQPGMPMMPQQPGMPMPQQPGMPMMPQPVMPQQAGMGMMPQMPSGAVPIAIGQALAGALQAGDRTLNDGSLGDDYVVMLTAGQPVTIITRGGPRLDMPGVNLDPYTLLLVGEQQLTYDDDSAGNLNSRIVWTPTMTGPHVIRVSTYGSGMKQGHYTLQVLPGANPTAI